MILQPAMHRIRDTVVRSAAYRAFRPIEEPKKRIVLIRPDHFGDLLMLSPVLNQIRDHARDHELVLMTGPWNREVAEHIATVDQIVTWEFPGFSRESARSGLVDPYREIGEAAALLRDLDPVAAIVLRDDHWWGAWMTREAGIPLRFGYAHPQVEPFLTHPMEINSGHYVEQNYELVQRSLSVLGLTSKASCGVPRMNWPVCPKAAEEAQVIRDHFGTGDHYVIIHPGTGAPVKCWPVGRWAEVINRLNQKSETKIVLTGSPGERSLCDEIGTRSHRQVTNLAGETSFFTLAEIFRHASLVMGVDSGPLHLAAAVETPSIHLYGPSNHVRYGPWGDSSKHCVVRSGMQCPSCGDLSRTRAEGCGCMMAITADQVLSAAREVLGYAG